MRPKFVVSFLCLAAAAMALIGVIHNHGAKVGDEPAASLSEASFPSGALPPPARAAIASADQPKTSPERPAAAPDSRQYEDWVRDHQARLMELSAREDADSLRAILTELSSPDPQIRKTALVATRQFGNRDAIPYLQEVADRTDDAREKVKILDTIDFLKMPSLTELNNQARAGQGAAN